MSEKTNFEIWWDREGSKPPKNQNDWETHCKELTSIAWTNGMYEGQNPVHPDKMLDEAGVQGVCFEVLGNVMERCGVQNKKDAHLVAMSLVKVLSAFLEKTTQDNANVIKIVDALGNQIK